MSKSAKEHMESIAYGFWLRAADAHARGMALAKTSARIGQLCSMSSEEAAAESLQVFIEYGTVRMVDGNYEIVDEDEALMSGDFDIHMTTTKTGLS